MMHVCEENAWERVVSGITGGREGGTRTILSDRGIVQSMAAQVVVRYPGVCSKWEQLENSCWRWQNRLSRAETSGKVEASNLWFVAYLR
jgi:hypothetical protein